MTRLVVFGFLFAVSAHAEVLGKSAVFAGMKRSIVLFFRSPTMQREHILACWL